MINKGNPSHELQKFRIKRDNQDLASISAKIDETINPFSDYESCFARKGKVRPLQVTRENDDFLKGLSMLEEEITPNLGSSKNIEQFVCTLHGMPKVT